MSLRLYSWNVNGLRAVVRKELFAPFLRSAKPDILCMQEVKISEADRLKAEFDFPKYKEYWNCAKKPGYAGTATLIAESLKQPLATCGIGVDEFDNEGRIQTLEFDKFYLVNTYYPHTRHDLSRLEFKGNFNNKMIAYLKKLDKKKPVILTGDLNVAHEEIDLARPKDNQENPGFHPEERKAMTKLLDAGFVDSFRHLHPKDIKYSWWSMRFGARKRNVGWRIDYFVVSERLEKSIKKAEVHDAILGSDHCPVSLEIEI